MEGREYRDNQYRNESMMILKGKPSYLRQYYYSCAETESARRTFLRGVVAYLEYLEENGYSTRSTDVFSRIKPADINMYIYHVSHKKTNRGNKDRNVADSTVVLAFRCVNSFYKFLENNDYIKRNPCDKANKPKDKKEHEVIALNKEDIEKIKNNIFSSVTPTSKEKKYSYEWKLRDYALIILGITTGMRIGSMLEINISDINFENNSIRTVVKGQKERNIFFPDSTKDELLRWINTRRYLLIGYEQTDALFITTKRQRMSYANANVIMKKYTSDIDKHITPHKLRSTCATNLYNETKDIYLVAQVLGHSDIKNTQRYATNEDGNLKKAADILGKLI